MTLEYQNLIGVPFNLGTDDCFSLTQKFYDQNYGIKMRNYARPNDWRSDAVDIIELAFPREGFHKVEDWTLATLQPGDLLAMAVGQSKANHLAVFVGSNTIVHHVIYQFSKEEMLRDFWRKSICYVLRHKDVLPTVVEKPSVNVEELIRGRYNLTAEDVADG